MTHNQSGDRILQHLVGLAQGQRSDAPWRERQFLEHFEERLDERRRTQARSRRHATLGVALAVCSAVAVFTFYLLRPTPLSYRVAGGVEAHGYIESQGKTSVQFSDGSQLALAPGTRARVNETTTHGSRVELDRGQATVNVINTGKAAWFVEAGPYTVHVTGTAFDVRWNKEDQRFELDMHHGSVVITGAPIAGRIALKAGQKLVSLPSGPIPSPSTPAAKADPAPEEEAAATVAGGDEPATVENTPEPARAPMAPNAPSWSRLVAQGKFQEVIDAARARGVKEVLSSASLADLSALADAARYARNTSFARDALLSARKRYPGSRPARDAAFFLGSLEDGGARASIAWYERYLAESPSGTYTSQALGRRLMLLYRERGAEAATQPAKDYLARFPKGPYASAARKILDRPHP